MPSPGVYRPRPDDFADNAWLSQKVLTQMYAAGQQTISRWRAELGEDDPRLACQMPPDDLAERMNGSSKAALCRHYGVGVDRMNSWLKTLVTGPAYLQTRPRRPIPDDFAEVGPTLTISEMKRAYTADYDTVKRWCNERDVVPATYDYTKTPPPRTFTFRGHAQTLRHADLRTITMYDEAADILRRERFIVFRCDARGRANPKGDFWRSGNTLLTPDELLQRAQKYRKVAA